MKWSLLWFPQGFRKSANPNACVQSALFNQRQSWCFLRLWYQSHLKDYLLIAPIDTWPRDLRGEHGQLSKHFPQVWTGNRDGEEKAAASWLNCVPRERLPTPVFWSGEFQGLYNPWDHKESDTTEQLSLSLSVPSSLSVDSWRRVVAQCTPLTKFSVSCSLPKHWQFPSSLASCSLQLGTPRQDPHNQHASLLSEAATVVLNLFGGDEWKITEGDFIFKKNERAKSVQMCLWHLTNLKLR